MTDWLDKQLDRMVKLFAIVGAIGILALMLIVLVAVIWRYVIQDPIFGIEDLSVLALSVVAASSVIYGARNNAHVSVNVIKYFFGRKVTRYTDLLMRLLTLTILLLAGYALIDKACGFEKACITNNLSIEHRPFFYVLSAAMFMYALHVFIQLVVGLAHFNAVDPNEPLD